MLRSLHCALVEGRGGDGKTAHPHLPHWVGRARARACVCARVCPGARRALPLPHSAPITPSSLPAQQNLLRFPRSHLLRLDWELERTTGRGCGDRWQRPSHCLLGPGFRGFNTGNRFLPWDFAHGGWVGGAQDLSLGCDFTFFMIDRSGCQVFQGSKECIFFQRRREDPKSPWVERGTWGRGDLPSRTWDPLIWLHHQSYRF